MKSSPVLLALLLVGCPSAPPEEEQPPPTPEPFTPGPWDRSQPDLRGESTRGWRDLRAIVHLHSHWSHDACDGAPQPDGVPDEACLADLRAGLCEDRIDVAFLSDHPTHVEETDYATLLLARGDDQPVANDAGRVVGTRISCASGHEVLLLPGVEASEMMPLALDETMNDYSADSAADFDRITEAGGLRWIAHTETRDLEQLGTLGLEGIELYQLHANLAPDLREDFLGLPPYAWLGEVGPFFFPETNGILDPPHPDLAPLGFLVLNEPSILALETLGQQGRIGISGGTDAHQNVLPAEASDFERIDSYRRMMRWFHTRLRVPAGPDPVTPDEAESALREARSFVAFEVFGTPSGFDLQLLADGALAGELGDELPYEAGMELLVTPPTLDPRSPRSAEAPEVITRIYFADGAGRTLLAEAEGSSDLRATVPGPGVVRVEVWLAPRHLGPYLGEVAERYLDVPVPWIQTGGIFLR